MSYSQNFFETLIAHSVNKNKDECIKEWKEEYRDKERSHCICGHEIHQRCFIKNIRNNNILTVGNCCIRKFGKTIRKKNVNKIVYLEHFLQKCKNDWEKNFLNSIIKDIKKGYKITIKQVSKIEEITGEKWKWNKYKKIKFKVYKKVK
ncbi:MAG: hypothetical protein WC501_02295 [Candidatus Micrarchaeia archaeon]